MSYWAFALLDERSGGEGSGEWALLLALLERSELTNYMCFRGIFLAVVSAVPAGLGLAFELVICA